jgi:hypothetical protein
VFFLRKHSRIFKHGKTESSIQRENLSFSRQLSVTPDVQTVQGGLQRSPHHLRPGYVEVRDRSR